MTRRIRRAASPGRTRRRFLTTGARLRTTSRCWNTAARALRLLAAGAVLGALFGAWPACAEARAQGQDGATGAIAGTVIDKETGQPLPGAGLQVTGTDHGAATDRAGRFTIRNLPPAVYEVRVACPAYTSRLERGIEVTAGGVTVLDIALDPEAFVTEDFVVTAEKVLATEAALLADRMRSAIIGDAISAEQIGRSPDATSGDALKRVTGLSLVDNKFVYVRGVTDRYNSTSLTGVSVASTDTDVDKKSFSFDLVPASLLDHTVVVKTATPDLPGDFSGGLVQLNTLSFPPNRVIKLTVSTAQHSGTTGETMRSSFGGDQDWLGRDDGGRAYPEGDLQGNALARALPNNWTVRERTAPTNRSLNVSVGDTRGWGERELGYVAAAVYRDSYSTRRFEDRPTVIIPGFGPYPLFDFRGTRYQRSVLWGGMLNLNLKLSYLHKLSWKNNYNQVGEEKISLSEGLPVSGEFTRRQTIEWDERSLLLTQLGGEHKLPALGGIEAAWRAYRSASLAEEPDRRHVEYERGASEDFAMKENYRTWSTVDEEIEGAALDLTYPFGPRAKLKAGTLAEFKERSYDIKAWATDAASVRPPNFGLLTLPLDQIFAPENYGPGKFSFTPITVFTGAYDGQHRLNAWYGMLDLPLAGFARRLRLVGGARVENSDQTVQSIASLDNPQPLRARVKETDVLPSLNLTYGLRADANLRLAYSRSLNRPEFRELANVLYRDFNRDQNVLGNPNLQRALVDNYDARAEYFPRPGEVLAASFFYKTLENAIEERLIPAPERFVRTWFNSPAGHNYGWEFEVRKSLAFLGGFWRNVSLGGNYTRVLSAIEYTEAYTDAQGNRIVEQRERIMQGQAPWSINLSLLISAPSLGTSLSVLYNKIGRRLDAVGDARDDDVYEEPRDVVDLALTQRIAGRGEAKFAVRDLNSHDELLTSGPDKSVYSRLKRGTTYTLSLGMSF